MRRALVMMMALQVACHDASSAPPTVVVPVASAASASSVTDDAAAPEDARLEYLRSPPTTVQALLDALQLPLAAAWESRDKSGMGGFAVRSPSPSVRALTAAYHWDMYHQNPATKAEELGPKTLESWSLSLPGERHDAVVRTLRGRWGAAQSKEKPDHAPVEQYGAFYVGSANSESFTVEWFAHAPDWSKAKVDPAVRKKAVSDLAKAIANAQTVEEMQKAAATPYAGAGITSKGAYNTTDANLEFEPPMPAAEFAAAIGHAKVIGQSVGVHMSHWKLVEVTGTSAVAPRLGSWEVDASLDGHPSGAKDARFPTGPTAHYALGPADVVRYVQFAKRP